MAAAALDRRLLLSSLAAAGTGPPHDAHSALALLEAGEYAAALAAALRSAWGADGGASSDAAPESTPDWFEAAAGVLQRLLAGPDACAAVAEQLLVAAVAALCLFTQANLAGPALPLPECPFDWLDPAAEREWTERRREEQARHEGGGDAGAAGSGSSAGAEVSAGFGRDSTSRGDRCAALLDGLPAKPCHPWHGWGEAADCLCCPPAGGRQDPCSQCFCSATALPSITTDGAPLLCRARACRWAGSQLSEDGEDLVGRVQCPQYLLLARTILLAPLQVSLAAADGEGCSAAAAGAASAVQPAAGAAWLGGSGSEDEAAGGAAAAPSLPGWCWWALRAALLQQRLLSGRSASLRSLLLGLQRHVLAGFAVPVEAALTQAARHGGSGGTCSAGAGSGPSATDQALAAGALLEAALQETAFGHVDAAKAFLQRASDVLGFRSGAPWYARCAAGAQRGPPPLRLACDAGWRYSAPAALCI